MRVSHPGVEAQRLAHRNLRLRQGKDGSPKLLLLRVIYQPSKELGDEGGYGRGGHVVLRGGQGQQQALEGEGVVAGGVRAVRLREAGP